MASHTILVRRSFIGIGSLLMMPRLWQENVKNLKPCAYSMKLVFHGDFKKGADMNLVGVLILAFGIYIGCDSISDGLKELARSIRERRS
jgi:hypothetical protein